MRTIALAFLPSSMAVFRPSEVYSISSLIPKSRPYSRNIFLFSLCSIFISFRLSWFIVFLCAYDSSYYRSMSSSIFRLCEALRLSLLSCLAAGSTKLVQFPGAVLFCAMEKYMPMPQNRKYAHLRRAVCFLFSDVEYAEHDALI